MDVDLCLGESCLGAHLVERLRRSKLLSEEPSDDGNTNGDAVPFLDLGRTGQSTMDQSGTGFSTVCQQGRSEEMAKLLSVVRFSLMRDERSHFVPVWEETGKDECSYVTKLRSWVSATER